MKILRLKASLATVLLALSASVLAQSANMNDVHKPAAADTIFTNGHIRTPDGWATSIAISHGAIVALGDGSATSPHQTVATKVIDLGGKTMLPGLHDLHVHAISAGLEEMNCRIPQGAKPATILGIVAACVKSAQPGEWVNGRAYEASMFGNAPPHKSMLDKISGNVPVVLSDISFHTRWANSAALKIAGITRKTPNPEGGIIEHDAKGEPTGILRESAALLIDEKAPPPSRDRMIKALQWSIDTIKAEGITSYTDAGLSARDAEAYAALADAGALKLRVSACIWARDPWLIAHRGQFVRDRFSPDCVKVVLDGVPTEGHTAALVEPYADTHMHGAIAGEADRTKGLLLTSPAELSALVTRLDAAGLTVKFHAAGDAAVRAGLDAIAAARSANGFSGQYHNIAHNSFIQPADIARARGIGATFEFSPYIWYPNPIIPGITHAVGTERMKRWMPVKDALDAGVMSVPGSDWSVVPSVSPWIAIETLVTRKAPGGGGEALGEGQRITLDQALDMFTRASARQMNMMHLTGTLEVGKLADLIVIDRDPYTVLIETIHDTKVLMTMVNGEIIYVRP